MTTISLKTYVHFHNYWTFFSTEFVIKQGTESVFQHHYAHILFDDGTN